MTRALNVIGGATAVAAGLYGGYVALTYARFGHVSGQGARNPLLDELMPEYEVRERHSVSVSAPAEITLPAACEISFHDSRIVRTIFGLRALPGRLLGGPRARTQQRPVLDEVLALGWRELAQVPGRQVIMGAVTQPWRQQVHFHGLPVEEFVTFRDPGYAKIAWTIEVRPAGPLSTVFATETRVVTTDPVSRERFRRYWAFLSPGIRIIRFEILRLVKAEAERRSGSRPDISQTPSIRSDSGCRS
jgi:hypothetical protein